ncbi:MAG: hypothetical protein ABSD20_19120 [Terriglobales bacterium]
MTLTICAFGQGRSSGPAGGCGKPVDGVELCLSRSATMDAALEVRNTGTKSKVLNLGMMVANGASLYPTAINLVLTDTEGTEYHTALAESFAVMGGRIDPMIVLDRRP